MDTLEREHSLAMIDEISPESTVSYVESFYVRHPDKFKPSNIDKITVLKNSTRDHIKRHIAAKMEKKEKKKRKLPPVRVRPIEGIPTIRLGPLGPERMPYPVTRNVLFKRGGYSYLQNRQMGRFSKEPGATTHTLRRLRTFLRGVKA